MLLHRSKPLLRNTLLVATLFFLPFLAEAQQSQSFTLQQCVDYALQNSGNYKNAKLDEQINTNKIRQSRAVGLPQINGSVSLVDNIELSKFFMPLTADNPLLGAYVSQLPKDL